MLPERVIWTQGLGISPVHFQQQDRYTDIQIRLRGGMLQPHGWGFTEFEVDRNLLALGKIVLNKASGILPDGTMFSAEDAQNGLVLDIAPGETDRVVTLALPLSAQGTAEARDEKAQGLSTRYIRSPRRIRDHNVYNERDSSDLLVTCGRLDLRLLYEEDATLKGDVAMPVVRVVECRQDKSIILDEEFLPTFLHIGASPTLNALLREVIGLVEHRAEHLAARISNAGQTGTAELGDFMLLQCLNRTGPLFRHLETQPRTHPEEFYRFLLSLVGELSTFAERGKRPPVFGGYNHNNQHRSFADIMEMARFVLSMVLEQHAVLLPLQDRQNNIQVAPIHDKHLLGTALFVLVAHADMDQESLRAQLPKQIKIGTPENIRELVNTHLPGVKIQPMPVAPRQIPFHAGKSYFHLDFSSEQRAQLEVSTGCAIHVSGSFPGLTLQLWAIKE